VIGLQVQRYSLNQSPKNPPLEAEASPRTHRLLFLAGGYAATAKVSRSVMVNGPVVEPLRLGRSGVQPGAFRYDS
jgi:hypothetical protein